MLALRAYTRVAVCPQQHSPGSCQHGAERCESQSRFSRRGANPAVQVVSWFRLFNCDAFDYLAIFLGLAGSLANAPIMPLFAVVFGDVCFFATLACVLLISIGTSC